MIFFILLLGVIEQSCARASCTKSCDDSARVCLASLFLSKNYSSSGVNAKSEIEKNDTWEDAQQLTIETDTGTYVHGIKGTIDSYYDVDLLYAVLPDSITDSMQILVSKSDGSAYCKAYQGNQDNTALSGSSSTYGMDFLGNLSSSPLRVTLTPSKKYLRIKCSEYKNDYWEIALYSGTEPSGTVTPSYNFTMMDTMFAFLCTTSANQCKDSCKGAMGRAPQPSEEESQE